jgi:hypothetical protein
MLSYNNNSSVIMDFQYLRGNSQNEFFIKELSTCTFGKFDMKSYHFKPPYGIQQLTSLNAMKCNTFIENNRNISWNDGCLDYTQVENVLLKFADKNIFVKGLQKKRLLKMYLPNTAIENLENLFVNMPSLNKLRDYDFKCLTHYKTNFCAHKNVINMIMFLEKEKQ